MYRADAENSTCVEGSVAYPDKMPHNATCMAVSSLTLSSCGRSGWGWRFRAWFTFSRWTASRSPKRIPPVFWKIILSVWFHNPFSSYSIIFYFSQNLGNVIFIWEDILLTEISLALTCILHFIVQNLSSQVTRTKPYQAFTASARRSVGGHSCSYPGESAAQGKYVYKAY